MKGTHKSIREWIEEKEVTTLSEWACLSRNTQGRQVSEAPHPCRTAFQRDRGRIIHSKSFRRLRDKTQVFFAPRGDHYRTRLTHTLEVAQIARTISRALGLNEDLTEAIALGHDLGHTPFGHAGEAVLERLNPNGFSHSQQSLRVVDQLEEYKSSHGLNLTFEVRDGIARHSKASGDLLAKGPEEFPSTLEGEVARLSDGIAYINHDIDDAVRAEVITLQDLPQKALERLSGPTGELIDCMAMDVIFNSQEGAIHMSSEVREAANDLRNYMYNNVYCSDAVQRELIKAQKCLEAIYEFLLEHPEEIPSGYREAGGEDDIHQWITDFVSGMTDRFAMSFFSKQFLPDTLRI